MNFKLIELFDCLLVDNNGVSEEVYTKIYEIATQIDDNGLLASYLVQYVNATDGRFYLKEGILLEGLIREGC